MNPEALAALAELARQRQEELDAAIAAWRQEAGAGVHLWCRPGCGNCCTLAVNTTLPEALAIACSLPHPVREKLAATATRIIAHVRQCADGRDFLAGYRQAVGPCPFLEKTDNCAIYVTRPLACRALLATRPPDWCGVNLAGLPAYERDAFLGSLDHTVVAYPTHYAAAPQALATAIERGLLFSMLQLNGFAVSGNLPLLVWLCAEEAFPAVLTDGIATLRAFLASHDANRPFLVQFDAP
jgi:hypothetical protein